MAIKIYTDGASSPKTTQAAGWAFAISPIKDGGVWKVYWGYLPPPSTNNIAEMLGVLNALKTMYSFSKQGQARIPDIEIYSDSQYVINGLTKYRWGWERNGMPEKNTGIWYELFDYWDKVKSISNLGIFWVRGHTGIEGNEIADDWSRNGKYDSALESNGATLSTKKVNGNFDDFLNIKTA